MGTIAARDCLRVLELSEQVGAAMLIAARQALDLRQRMQPLHLTASLSSMFDALCNAVGFVEEDRALDGDLQHLLGGMRAGFWCPYRDESPPAQSNR